MASLSAPVSDRTLSGASTRGRANRPSQRPLFPVGLVVDVRTADCQELEGATVGWDVRYTQLDAGAGRFSLVAIHTAHLQLSVEAWPFGMLKTGRCPRNAVTFVAPVGHGAPCRFQGRPYTAGDILVLFENDEFDLRSAGPARVATVSIERTSLERHTRAILGCHLGELRLQGRLSGLRTNGAAFRGVCHDAVARATAHAWLLRDTVHADGLETKLVKALFSGFSGPRNGAAPSRSHALARRAEAWLRQNIAEAPPIACLCEALDTSERRLHEAFRQHLGTTPKAYLKALRLNAARRDLLRGPARTRVTDVALDWGFSHFGWFSQDYRRLFAETPSQTLQRGRTDESGRCFPGRESALGA